MNSEVLLSLGSNIPDGQTCINRAIALLTPHLSDVRVTESYLTPSEPSSGGECDDGRPYLNAVLRGCYDGSYDSLYAHIKQIEHTIGRRRDDRRNVPIDIDIVMMDGHVIRDRDYESRYFQIGLAML